MFDPLKDDIDLETYKARLQEAINKKLVGMTRKKKMVRLLRYLNARWVDKDEKFQIRYSIKSLHL